MKFGEKLLQLRKEKNLSQEALADSLDVSRQAVSRWENDQGYPETDKLLQLGNLFGVSMDYLLKEEPATEEAGERGYYASRELVEGFLRQGRQDAWRTASAVFLMIVSVLPNLFFPDYEVLTGMAMLIIIFGAIAMLVSLGLRPDKYKKLKTEPLCFDVTYIANLREEYAGLLKRYNLLLLGGGGLILLAMLYGLAVEEWGSSSSDANHGGVLVLLAAAVFLFFFAGGVKSGYEMLLNNEEYRVKKSSSWIWGVTMGLTTCVFVIAAMLFRARGLSYSGAPMGVLALLYPIAAILTAAYIRSRRRRLV